MDYRPMYQPRTAETRWDSDTNRGVVYLLTGPAHATRLAVSIMSLRRYWPGDITIYTTHPTSHEVGRLLAADRRLDVVHRTWRLFPARRNASFLTKVDLLPHAPYERCVYLDADTLVVGQIDELFAGLDRSPLVATRFAEWNTSGRTMRRRIESWGSIDDRRWKPKLRDAMLAAAVDSRPAINSGVVGFRSREAIVRRWRDLTHVGHRKFICDEIALQILLPQSDAEVVDCRFNCSPIYARRTSDVRVWHFHGEKHLRHPNGREIWLPAYRDCFNANFGHISSWGAELDLQVAKFASGP